MSKLKVLSKNNVMRLITGLILGFTSIWMNAQIQDIEIDFSNGNDIAYYNYINSVLNIDTTEIELFWEKYYTKTTDEKKIKTEIKNLKQSLVFSFNKSKEEVILIINQITELEILLKKYKRDFILDCIFILDKKRAIEFSIYDKNFRTKLKEYTSTKMSQ